MLLMGIETLFHISVWSPDTTVVMGNLRVLMCLCNVLQVWQKAGVFYCTGPAVCHSCDPGLLCELDHVLYPQLSVRTGPDILLPYFIDTGYLKIFYCGGQPLFFFFSEVPSLVSFSKHKHH